MELSAEQKKKVEEWVKEGLNLSDIQKRITKDLGVAMTYMDVRLLVIDLGLKVKDKVAPAAPIQPAESQVLGAKGEMAAAPAGPSRVSVEVDRITRPGSVVSGSVTFSDGTRATWMLDEMGRLALDAGKKRYTPSREDLQAFQEELRKLLENQGF